MLRMAAMSGNIEVRGEIVLSLLFVNFIRFFPLFSIEELFFEKILTRLQIINMLMDATVKNANELSERDCATIREEVSGLWVHGARFVLFADFANVICNKSFSSFSFDSQV